MKHFDKHQKVNFSHLFRQRVTSLLTVAGE